MRARVAVAAACSALAFCAPAPPEFDLAIRGGDVHDGSGEAPRRADVGIKGDRITAVGDLQGRAAGQTIDATGKVVSPGFIDTLGGSALALLADGSAEPHVRQGITTEILAEAAGPAFWPERTVDRAAFERHGVRFDWTGLGGYFDRLESAGTSVNVGALAPAARADESDVLDSAMRAGAFGVSSTLPLTGADAERSDMLALAGVAARHGGVYAARLSADAAHAGPALDAALSAGAERHVAVVLLNPRLAGPGASESMQALYVRIRDAVAAGQTVFTTQVPYTVLGPGAAAHEISEEDVRVALGHPFVTIGTGSPALRPDSPLASAPRHPAAYGAMPRVLGRYARDRSLISLGEAIRRMSSQAALQYRIPRRGIVREGYYADVVVFDPATVNDSATLDRPNEYPAGIAYVIVNGVVTVTPRGHTGARAGRPLLGPGREQP